MRVSSLVLLSLLFAVSANAGTFNIIKSVPQEKRETTSGSRAEKIKAYCHSDWAPDYSMVEHCIQQQSAALDKLVAVLDGIRPGTLQESIMTKCGNDWFFTTRPDANMTLACYEQSKEALDRLR